MIKYSIRGENLEVTEAIRDYVVSKLEKIEKYFQADQELDARVNRKSRSNHSAWIYHTARRRCLSRYVRFN